MPQNASARFSAFSRSYEYYITRKKNVFAADQAWNFHESLDIQRMNLAAEILLRHHDFVAFSKTGNTTSTTLCKLTEAYWTEENEVLVFHISSNRFLRNMVRAIVGTLVEIGKGAAPIERVEEILLSKKQPVTRFSVPANGLFLCDVKYPPEFGLE
jgi:tRNA pseudouridine38-40 synthase